MSVYPPVMSTKRPNRTGVQLWVRKADRERLQTLARRERRGPADQLAVVLDAYCEQDPRYKDLVVFDPQSISVTGGPASA